MGRSKRKDNADRAMDDLLKFLAWVPWWVGPIVAACAWAFFYFAVPAMFGMTATTGERAAVDNLPNNVFASVSRSAAPFVAMLILLAWVVSLFKKESRAKLIESTTTVESLREMSWEDFEDLVGEACRRQGYSVEKAGGAEPDGGVDLVLRKDGRVTLVQCKRWRTREVGVSIVRELRGVMASQSAQAGMIVCCGSFTDDAQAFARKNGIALIDGPKLILLVRRVQSERTANPAASHGHAGQASVAAPTAPTCPECGSGMVRRVAGKGPFAGQPFWGCSRYPRCKGKVE